MIIPYSPNPKYVLYFFDNLFSFKAKQRLLGQLELYRAYYLRIVIFY